jgi:hypothetical protein
MTIQSNNNRKVDALPNYLYKSYVSLSVLSLSILASFPVGLLTACASTDGRLRRRDRAVQQPHSCVLPPSTTTPALRMTENNVASGGGMVGAVAGLGAGWVSQQQPATSEQPMQPACRRGTDSSLRIVLLT